MFFSSDEYTHLDPLNVTCFHPSSFSLSQSGTGWLAILVQSVKGINFGFSPSSLDLVSVG